MIKSTILSICILLLTAPAFAQTVVNGCILQAYSKCPGVNLSKAHPLSV
jgi:hypothetical protein